MTVNRFQGLARGPIDHNASSVINSIADDAIEMGSAVELLGTIVAAENLPRVLETTTVFSKTYGIAVGGDADGIYSTTGVQSGTDATKATTGAGQGVVVCTQGRCLARVNGNSPAIVIGDKLTPTTTSGILVKLPTTGSGTHSIIAIALADADEDNDIIPVDVQREVIIIAWPLQNQNTTDNLFYN